MADKNTQEAYVAELPPDLPSENVGAGDPKSNLPSVKVDASDVEPDPRHAGPERLGRPKRNDPNAALRKARGVRPGLQDSEVINPAVWGRDPRGRNPRGPRRRLVLERKPFQTASLEAEGEAMNAKGVSAKEKRIRERLEQIAGRASAAAANEKDKTLANLAEEAASLGLELLEGGK
jgi:hypothetical protein